MAIGRKTGGRRKGTPNKRTLELQALAVAEPRADTPLGFLMAVYQNPELPIELRVDAAGKAARYVHPAMAATTLKGEDHQPIRHVFEWASDPPES
jgi:hypothetical protein